MKMFDEWLAELVNEFGQRDSCFDAGYDWVAPYKKGVDPRKALWVYSQEFDLVDEYFPLAESSKEVKPFLFLSL